MSKKTRRKQLSNKVMVSKRRDKPTDKKPNPFELKFNKQKHAVAGQRQRSTAVGLPSLSRHRAFEQRKRTLLNEYNRFGKTNEIVDRRLGERNVNLTPDQKMALRFAAERRRRYKGEMGDLASSSSTTTNFQLTGVDSILTHRGKSLTEIEKLNDRPMLDEDEEIGDDRLTGSDFVKLANFGGGEEKKKEAEWGFGHTSRKELIEEMIANSKRVRYEMQLQREQASDLTADLDDQWKEAVKDNLISKWIRNKDDEEHDHDHDRHQKKAKDKSQETSSSNKADPKKEEKKLDYDRLVHEMVFEPKAAKGVDKLKKIGDDGGGGVATAEKEGAETIEPETKREKAKARKQHITGDDDIGDLQRFKREKEKPFVVQYNSEGQLIRDDSYNKSDEQGQPAKKKPKSIGIDFLEPRIETNFNPEKKKRKPTAKGETAERQKLVQKYKKELRGTIRELRRDNQFLARQQVLEQQEYDNDRKRKVKSLMRSLVGQETECRKLKKQKKR